MDERLKNALDFSNYMITLDNQQRALKDTFIDKCVFYQNGGSFSISVNLIAFIKSLVDLGYSSSVVVDDNGIPIEIADLNKFLIQILDQYTNAANDYYKHYSNLTKTRSIESIVK